MYKKIIGLALAFTIISTPAAAVSAKTNTEPVIAKIANGAVMLTKIDIFDDNLPEATLRKIAERSGIKTEGMSREEVEKAFFTKMASDFNVDVTGLDIKQTKIKIKEYIDAHHDELQQKFKMHKDKKPLNAK